MRFLPLMFMMVLVEKAMAVSVAPSDPTFICRDSIFAELEAQGMRYEGKTVSSVTYTPLNPLSKTPTYIYENKKSGQALTYKPYGVPSQLPPEVQAMDPSQVEGEPSYEVSSFTPSGQQFRVQVTLSKDCKANKAVLHLPGVFPLGYFIADEKSCSHLQNSFVAPRCASRADEEGDNQRDLARIDGLSESNVTFAQSLCQKYFKATKAPKSEGPKGLREGSGRI